MPSTPSRLDDLDRLFRSLCDAGFAVGVEQALRIETVLRALGAAPPTDIALSDVIAALLLHDREQRPELDRVVDLWMQSLAPLQSAAVDSSDVLVPLSDPGTDASSQVPVEVRGAKKRKRRGIAWALGVITTLVGLLLAVWLNRSDPGLSDTADAALTTEANERADLRATAPDLRVPKEDLGAMKEAPRTHRVGVPTLTEQPREIPIAVRVWAFVAGLSALLGIGLWLVLRNRSYLPAPLPLPTRPGLPRIVPSAEVSHRRQSFLLSRREEDSAVWGIGQFISTQKTRRLDIPRTVSATADAAGQPRLHFVPARHAREVWLWLDESMGLSGDGGGDDTRRFVAELASALNLAGLPVEQARFWGIPEELSADFGTFSTIEVDERRDAALVLIFTDGALLRGALDSATDRPRIESLLRQLGHWPQMAFVDSTQGAACLPGLLRKYELLALLPEQVPTFLAGQSLATTLPVRGLAGPRLIGEERVWAAAVALSPTPVDDQTAHLLREHLSLTVSPWRISVLRSRAQHEAGGLLFGPVERARLLSWLLATGGGRASGDTRLGQALCFYRQLFDSEDQRRRQCEPAEPWLSTPSEHHLRMLQSLLLLWDDPERAAEQLFRQYRDPLAAEIRRHLAWIGPKECEREVERGLTVLPWAMKDRSPRARLLFRELGLGSASLQWKPRAESLRRPGRLPVGLGLCAGLSLLGLWGLFQSLPQRQGEPAIDNPSPPPGSVVQIHSFGAEQYEVLARHGSQKARLTVAGGSVVHVTWTVGEEPDRTWDAGTRSDLGPELSSLPDISHPEDLAHSENLRKPKERHDLATPEPVVPPPLPAEVRMPIVIGGASTTAGIKPSGAILEVKSMEWSCPYEERTHQGMVFVKVCGGDFMMGPAEDERSPLARQSAAHLVHLDTIWIGKYEVSNEQYRKAVFGHRSTFDGYELPVQDVDWNEAREYCRSIGGDLPTEAQWEYAARGPAGRKYPWGSAAPEKGRATFNQGRPDPITANPKGVGPFGTWNQAGNVWEWVIDCDDGDASAKWTAQRDQSVPPKPVTNPVDDRPACRNRVLRGGSFGNAPRLLLSVYRYGVGPGFRDGLFGFRCVIGSHLQP